MKVAGFFAGVGGIELGFQQAGFEIVWSNEIDKNAAITFSENHSSDLVVDDIKNIGVKDIPKVDVIVGGFPCQAFSVAGYRKGFEDERGEIFFQLARIIKGKKPRVIFIENVKNILTHDKGNTYRVIKETLESYGYYLKTMMLNASEYGNIPQNRERAYIIGFKKVEDLYNFSEIRSITLEKSISDIIDYNEKVDEKYYYKEDNCIFFKDLENKVKDKNTLYQWRRTYVRENKSNLCPTLTANMGMGGHNVPIAITKFGIRKLTPKECFLFQGYPKDFKLPENIAQSHLYKQAGNSVVVPVIYRIAKEILNAIKITDGNLLAKGEIMGREGKSFTVVLKRTHLEWGSYRKTQSREIIYGEGYIPIPIKEARELNLKNSNATQGQEVLGVNLFKCVSEDGKFNGVLKAQGSSTAGNQFAKQLSEYGDLKGLGKWYKEIGAQEGDTIKVSWISDTEISIKKI